MKLYGSFILLLFLVTGCMPVQQDQKDPALLPGASRLDQYLPLLEGKAVGVTLNQSALIDGKRVLDTLLQEGVKIVRAFGPEHGLSGKVAAAIPVDNGRDGKTGTPVTSLFGDHFKPTPEDLKGIEVMIFDMQDVGVRFYTYISTLHYVMEACAENNIPVIVLDRPNPNDGYVDGPVRDASCWSFIGMHPIPVVHGMTIGEYAQMINGQQWLKDGIQCRLTVVPMLNYHHGMDYELPVAPSPNLNTQRSIYLYPSLCWFGGTAVSDGRGTHTPFQLLGSPQLKGKYSFCFVPQPIPGMSERPMHMGDTCYGIDLREMDLTPVRQSKQLQLKWLLQLYKDFPDKSLFFNREAELGADSILHFDLQAGTPLLRKQIKQGLTEEEIRESWQPALEEYKKMRIKYLIYK